MGRCTTTGRGSRGRGAGGAGEKTGDKPAALKLMKRLMKRYGKPQTIVTDGLRS